MRKPFLLAIACCSAVLSFGQATLQGIINDYTTVTGFGACPVELTVTDASAFGAGDAILVYQAVGASINTGNSGFYGDVTTVGNAGKYERAEIDSVVGNTLWLNAALTNTYSINKTQVVRIPHYNGATVVGNVEAQAWNGQTGGVVALEVSGTLTLQADIGASGKGFAVKNRGNGLWFVRL